MIKQITHLAGLLTFTGQVATSIRMYSAYNQSGDDRDEFAKKDLMYLSDTLTTLEALGKSIASSDQPRAIYLCECIILSLERYIGEETFARNPLVNLEAAIDHLSGLKTALADQSPS